MDASENPFAPPASVTEPPPLPPDAIVPPRRPPRTVAASLALWTFVCTVSAAPSFLWGLGTIAGDQYVAMSLGICVFIALYTWGDQCTQTNIWRQLPPVALTLKIGFVTRLMLSVIFPIGALLDVVCGLMSVGVVEFLYPTLRSRPGGTADLEGAVGFLGAFLITLVQGLTLNIVLLGYMAIVLGIILAVQRPAAP